MLKMRAYTYFIGVSLGEKAIADQFRALGQELVRRGHRVVYLTWGPGSPPEQRVENPAVYRWPSPRPTKFRDAAFCWHMVRRLRPHCLIANFGATNVMMTVGFAAGVPCRVAWYWTLSKQIELDWAGSNWRIKWLRWRKRWVYKLATHIVGPSLAAVEDAQRVYGVPPEKCRVLHSSLPDPLAKIRTWSCQNGPVVLCVGRFHPSKGQDVLLQAMVRVVQQVPEARLRLIGQGPTLPYCKDLATRIGIASRCEFVDAIPHEDVFAEMASASVVVVPSRDEAFGFVAIEAMAVGTPVVASCVGGLAEIVRDGQDGFLVQPDDPGSLAEALIRILRDKHLRARLGQNARARFLDSFEQSRVVKEQADWLESIIAERVQEVPVRT